VSRPEFDVQGTFRSVVEALQDCGLPYAFIGALPVLAWGRVRATTDIDLVIAAESEWARLERAFRKRGLQRSKSVGPADSSDPLPDIAMFRAQHAAGTRVDVFIAKTDFERAVIDGARTATVLDTSVRLARPEASIVYKLLAARPRDVDDVEGIFEARAAARDVLDWTFLERWTEAWGISDRLEPYRRRFKRS
jgi:hypothetical protein